MFYINVPIALVILAAIPALMPAGIPAARNRLDILGAITVTGGLAAVVYAIVEAPEVGWSAARTWLVLAGAAALLALFLLLQAKRSDPLVRLGIFRTPNLGAANLAQLLLGGAWIPMWFFVNLYLQQVLGYAAFPSGAALLPMTGLILIGMIVLAPRAIARFGPKTITVTGPRPQAERPMGGRARRLSRELSAKADPGAEWTASPRNAPHACARRSSLAGIPAPSRTRKYAGRWASRKP